MFITTMVKNYNYMESAVTVTVTEKLSPLP